MERFITDVMLGRLSRWLRILGYDTRSDLIEDGEILRAAQADSRIVLTRDRDLTNKAHRMGIDCFYVGPPDLEGQLLTVFHRLGFDELELRPDRSRCALCNGELESVGGNDVVNQVPEKVLEFHSEFWRCRACHKVYWMGRHWENIEKEINGLAARLRAAADEDGPRSR
jgi:uncharacterized protein with PIN domain